MLPTKCTESLSEVSPFSWITPIWIPLSAARLGVLVALLLTVAGGQAQANVVSPTVSGALYDDHVTQPEPDTTTSTTTPSIAATDTTQTVAVFEFDLAPPLTASDVIASAALSFDVTPGLSETNASFVIGTYGGDGALTGADYSPTFESSNYYDSRGALGGGFGSTTHFEVDVISFVGPAVVPGSTDVKGFHFVSTTPTLPNQSTISNATLTYTLSAATVPEPSPCVLFGVSALAGLAGSRRGRRKRTPPRRNGGS